MELPDPPRRDITKQELKQMEKYEKELRVMLPMIKAINRYTDRIAETVDPNSVDRDVHMRMSELAWKGEFLERVLVHSVAALAAMDVVKYLAAYGGAREATIEEVTAAGYL